MHEHSKYSASGYEALRKKKYREEGSKLDRLGIGIIRIIFLVFVILLVGNELGILPITGNTLHFNLWGDSTYLKNTCSPSIESVSNASIIIVPYIGSFEASISEDWLKEVDDHLIKFHLENGIPIAFSFYTDDLEDNPEFDLVLKKVYLSPCFHIIQKGTDVPDEDVHLYNLSLITQKERIAAGRDNLMRKLNQLLPGKNITPVVSFNSMEGKVDYRTMEALYELGFKIYFELFQEDEVATLDAPSSDFDVYQYGIGYTKTGVGGPEQEFRSPEDIIKRIEDLSPEYFPVKYLGSAKIVPLYLENWDLEGYDSKNKEGNNKINATKWEIYKETLLELKSREDVAILNPMQIWELKHTGRLS